MRRYKSWACKGNPLNCFYYHSVQLYLLQSVACVKDAAAKGGLPLKPYPLERHNQPIHRQIPQEGGRADVDKPICLRGKPINNFVTRALVAVKRTTTELDAGGPWNDGPEALCTEGQCLFADRHRGPSGDAALICTFKKLRFVGEALPSQVVWCLVCADVRK